MCLAWMLTRVYFTSGSTESNNLAIRGACLAQRENPGKIITSTLGAFVGDPNRSRHAPRQLDWPIAAYVDAPDGVLRHGAAAPSSCRTVPTSLISVMRVQNETGWIFPIPEIAAVA